MELWSDKRAWAAWSRTSSKASLRSIEGLPFCRHSLQQSRRYLAAVLLSLRALQIWAIQPHDGQAGERQPEYATSATNSDTAKLGSAINRGWQMSDGARSSTRCPRDVIRR
jgi:hypothetical protein